MSPLDTKVKEVKRRRLARFLRARFNRRDFGFDWTDFHTAYFDGKTLFIKYDVNRKNREYTEAERHLIHLGLSYHEMGHSLYDVIDDYRHWVKTNQSKKDKDWQDNRKWPENLVAQWGNLGMDGRLESFLKTDYPFTAQELDFVNYEWAYSENTEEERGQSKVDDFMFMFGRRCLGMTDLDGWDKEVVDLMDLHQHFIDEAKKQPTTLDCLSYMKQHLAAVWPTLHEWMKEKGCAPESVKQQESRSIKDDVNWSNREEAHDNAKRAIGILDASNEGANDSSNEPKPPNKPDFKRLLNTAEKENKAAQEQAEEEEAEEQPRQMVVQTTYGNTIIENKIDEVAPTQHDEEHFNHMQSSNKREITALEKALRLILAPIPDERYLNQRQGRLHGGRVWRSTKCDNPNIRTKFERGLPDDDAYIDIMVDCSGSTSCEGSHGKVIIEEMKEALTIVLTATDKANVPSKAFAFTSDWNSGTRIYRLKPNETKFKPQHKSAIGGLTSKLGNRDVAALQYLLDDVGKRSETIRLAFMISDGAPNFYGEENEETIREMVKKAEKKGIDVFCIFVGDDDRGYKCAKRMYGDRVILSRTGLARDLKKHLLKVLAQRRGI